MGAKDPVDNSYVVHSSESPYYVRVSEFADKDMVEKAREDFVETISTPTPSIEEATPSPDPDS
ncbi:MAG: hypothetical protein GTO14_25495 [Anaerolineales bacterium]|nr:hypothetical protein [Anaerolineales bacterium]